LIHRFSWFDSNRLFLQADAQSFGILAKTVLLYQPSAGTQFHPALSAAQQHLATRRIRRVWQNAIKQKIDRRIQ
jgi:hypothetical protein